MALLEDTLSVERLDGRGRVLRPARMRFVSLDLRSRVLVVHADAEKTAMSGWVQLLDGSSLVTPEEPLDGAAPSPPYRFVVASPGRQKVFRIEALRLSVYEEWLRYLFPAVAPLPAPLFAPRDVAEHFSFSVRVAGAYEDSEDSSEEPSFELECHARFMGRAGQRNDCAWRCFATFPQIEAVDAALRATGDWLLSDVPFVRRHRKRRFIGFDRGKAFLAARCIELNGYLERLQQLPKLWNFPHPAACSPELRELVGFERFFGVEMEVPPDAPPMRHKGRRSGGARGPASKSRSQRQRQRQAESRAAAAVTAAWSPAAKPRRPVATPSPPEPSSSAASITPIAGREASDLRRVIFQSALDELQGDDEALQRFKNLLRAFWRSSYGRSEAEALGAFLNESFAPGFCTWLLRDLARLIPEVEGRDSLLRCTAKKPERSIYDSLAAATTTTTPPPPAASRRKQATAATRPASETTILTLQEEVLLHVRVATGDDAARLQEFRQQTRLYGQGQSSARTFYQYLTSVFPDAATMSTVLPTLVILLRDPEKRAALQAEGMARGTC